ncbi:hypothetical protein CQR81_26390 [Escherichia coli]|nr:hypothetical protein CQR81_26390 [Escherichia coli]
MDRLCEDYCGGIWNLYTLNNGGAFMAPEPDDDDDETWVLFNAMNGNRAEMSPEAAGIAACLMTYSHHACRTECYAMTVHYYRLRDYALQQVIKRALYHNAAAVVLAHNHPSGEVTPSKADRLITERLVQALGLVDIRVPDHLIVGGSQVFSFAERRKDSFGPYVRLMSVTLN